MRRGVGWGPLVSQPLLPSSGTDLVTEERRSLRARVRGGVVVVAGLGIKCEGRTPRSSPVGFNLCFHAEAVRHDAPDSPGVFCDDAHDGVELNLCRRRDSGVTVGDSPTLTANGDPDSASSTTERCVVAQHPADTRQPSGKPRDLQVVPAPARIAPPRSLSPQPLPPRPRVRRGPPHPALTASRQLHHRQSPGPVPAPVIRERPLTAELQHACTARMT